MNEENCINLSTTSNYLVQRWIGHTLSQSDSDWLIGVFKINGIYEDKLGIPHQILNQSTLPRFYKTVDNTIKDTRRRTNLPNLKFIPFIGGDKILGINAHIHAFIEIPKIEKKWKLHDVLQKNWTTYANRVFKDAEVINPVLWLQDLDKSRIGNHLSYCQRYEGSTFFKGTEKVLFECKSCLI